MAQINITVPDDAMPLVEEQASSRGFASPTALVQSLLDDELARARARALEAELVRRTERGKIVDMDDADFRRMEDELRSRLTKAGGK